ncbi:uncharacterized protein L203_101605 [Cryptococcus depauperatus CBS 7841]|uniref:Mitogen-activated protein kinase n=1 Tax=Cryptococcus depauperatus CBS 7841 TaxID=1295531 RepID=A0A1E3IT38_9TREE|nr:CMGC/MAPK protein kinase [Cryptococcus depauperatus CBS 7841]
MSNPTYPTPSQPMIPRSQPQKLAHADSMPNLPNAPTSDSVSSAVPVNKRPCLSTGAHSTTERLNKFCEEQNTTEEKDVEEKATSFTGESGALNVSRDNLTDKAASLLPSVRIGDLPTLSSKPESYPIPNFDSTSRAPSRAPTPAVIAPQTGASKMAAAAKRGLDVRSSSVPTFDNHHPLNDKNLQERGYQMLNILDHPFHLPKRWKLLRPLGQGAYGLVAQVQDTLTGTSIAVKCITKVFDKVILAKRALREITLLRHFGDHDNLTGLVDMDIVWDGYNEIYIYMEPMEADLHQIVRSGQPLTNAHVQFFLYQLLRGMKYIHTANVIHRDLKPGNLLVNSDCELKICDFGLARGFRPVNGEEPQGEEGKLTEYVATRWYRAPEIMLSNKRYTTAIDVWSIGCILAELVSGKPFFKGKDYIDQLNLILDVLGTPDERTAAQVGSEKACAYLKTLPYCEKKDFSSLFPNTDPEAVDLISQLLRFDYTLRPTVNDSLLHPYVSKYHDELDEPSCPEIFNKWEQVESLETIEELREAITREIQEYREEVRAVAADSSDVSEQAEWQEEEDSRDETVSKFAPPLDSASPSAPSPFLQTPGPGMSTIASGNASKGRSVPFPAPPSELSSRTALQADAAPRTKDHSPNSPYTPLTEESFSAPGVGRPHRYFRRSSAYSLSGKRMGSFLFGSFGGGMTPLVSGQNLPDQFNFVPDHQTTFEKEKDKKQSGHWRSRSRVASQAGDLVLERLSSIELRDQDEKDRIEAVGKVVGLGGDAEVPPMTVSPGDAPTSGKPKRFGV